MLLKSRKKISHRLILAIFSFAFFSISVLYTFLHSFRYFEDYSFTVIQSRQNWRKISGNKLSEKFKAAENNLGTIAIKFNNGNSNIKQIKFRIKEGGQKKWYYQNVYSTKIFQYNKFFPIGFPVIQYSKGKEYVFEVEPELLINKSEPTYLIKYSFPKEWLLKNKGEIVPFLFKKLASFFGLNDYLLILIITFIPFFVYLFNKFIAGKAFYRLQGLEKKTCLKHIIPGSLFILTVLISGYFSVLSVDPHHDGIMFKTALDIAHGKMIFRDTFTYAALPALLQALSLKMFGDYLIIIKVLTALFYGFISILLWIIWSRFLPKFIVAISIITWIFIAPYFEADFLSWSSVYALFFQLLSAFLLIKYFEIKSTKYLFFSGMIAALVFWTRMPVGIFLMAFTGFFLLFFVNFKKLITYLAGSFFIFFIFFVWLFLNHALNDWWRQTFIFPYSLTSYSSDPQNITNPLFPGSNSPVSIWSVFPLVCILYLIKLGLVFLNNKRGLTTKEIIILSLLFISISSWFQYYPYPCIRHVYWASTLMIGFFAFFIWELTNFFFNLGDNNISKRILLFLFIFTLLLFPDIKHRIESGIIKIQKVYIVVDEPEVLRGLKLTKENYLYYKNTARIINNYLKSHPGKELVNNGYDGIYLTLVYSTNYFNRVFVNWDKINSHVYPGYPDDFYSFVQRNKPLVIGDIFYLNGYCQINEGINSVKLMAPCLNKKII